MLGAARRDPLKSGTELFRNDEMRVWTLDGEVLIASITAQAAPDRPGRGRGPGQGRRDRRGGYKGLVIWSPDDVFSAGANLESLMPVFMKQGCQGHRAG